MVEEARNRIKAAIKLLKRGLLSIEEAEEQADRAIAKAVDSIPDVEERIETTRKLKRFKWNRLIEATRER